MTPTEKTEIHNQFKKSVNMTASQIESFLKTDHSKEVGQKPKDGGESTGHASGRHIVEILRKKVSEFSPSDYNQMKRTSSYVARHLAQGGPDQDKEHSKWRYSLMNWGHDPCK